MPIAAAPAMRSMRAHSAATSSRSRWATGVLLMGRALRTTSSPLPCPRGCARTLSEPDRGISRSGSDRACLLAAGGSVVVVALDRGRLLDLHEELDVAARLLQAVDEQLDALLRVERGQHPAQLPDDLELLGRHEDLLAARARRVDVDGREDAPVGELARQAQLHVPGALELLEDDLVHLRTGLDERGREDGERATVLDVAGGTEEALRRVQRAGVHATGQDPAARRGGEVVGAAQTRDRVEQHDHVVAHLDQALGALDRQLGDRGVVLGRTVEGGGDDLTLDRALHVGDLLGALVHQDDHEVRLGVVGRDRVGDGLQDHRLARLGRADDEAALALADRRDEVDEPRGQHGGLGLQAQALLGVQRGELAELGAGARLLGGHPVDRVQADQRVELLPRGAGLLALAQRLDGTGDGVTLAQAVLLDHAQRDVDVVRAGQVAAGAHEGVVVEDVEDAGDRDEHVVVGHGLGAVLEVVLAAPATTLAVAVTLTAAATPAALLVEVVAAAATTVVGTALATTVVAVAPGVVAVATGVVAVATGVVAVATGVVAVTAVGALATALVGPLGPVAPGVVAVATVVALAPTVG